MCGYCMERFALDILNKESHGNLRMKDLKDCLTFDFCLRETADFLSALDKVRRSLARKKLVFFSNVPPVVLLYRGLEILIGQGFDSPAYRKLLKNPLYSDAIIASCSEEKRKQFDKLTEGLRIEYLGLLYDAETYLSAERSEKLRNSALALPACRNLLKHYIAWWLDGKKLKMKDLVEKYEELDIMGRFTDAEYMVQTRSAVYDQALDFRFGLLVRALYFSILMVGGCLPGKRILLEIAQKRPAKIPWFDGEDLWLQRIAALKLYDLEGFDAFPNYVSTLRATLYYYIDLVRGFTLEHKQLLMDEARRHPDSENTDDFIRLSDWLCEELGEVK